MRLAIDRERVKAEIGRLIGPGHVVPTLAVLRSGAEIERFEFPLPCVVKPARLCREQLVVEGAQPDKDVRRTLKYWLRRFLVEEDDATPRGKLLVEPPVRTDALVRVYCFHGRARFLERVTAGAADYFDPAGRRLDFEGRRPPSSAPFPEPGALETLRDYSQRLSESLRFLRLDCELARDRVVVAEINDHAAESVAGFRPRSVDALLARLFDDPTLELTPDLVAATAEEGGRE